MTASVGKVLKRQALCQLRARNRVSRPEYSCFYWWLLYCMNCVCRPKNLDRSLACHWLFRTLWWASTTFKQIFNREAFPICAGVGWLHLGVLWQWPWRERPRFLPPSVRMAVSPQWFSEVPDPAPQQLPDNGTLVPSAEQGAEWEIRRVRGGSCLQEAWV